MIKVESQIAGRKLTIETGAWAKQANGSCKVTYGDTVVLCAVTMGDAKNAGFMPLTVDYKEMTYAAGKIPGGFFKREGRPRDSEILTSRIVDRSLRPLFPKGFVQEVLVSIRVLSHDIENKSDMLALIGSSAALLVSDIPFTTAVAVCRVGLKEDSFIVNPTIPEIAECSMDLIVAGTKTGITMIEGGGDEVSEEKVESAVNQAKPVIDTIIALCEDLRGKAGKEKVEGIRMPAIDDEFKSRVTKEIEPQLLEAFKEKSHTKRGAIISAIKGGSAEKLEIGAEEKTAYAEVFDGCIKDIFLKKIKVDKERLDGRAFDELRPISAEVSVLPRTHGSAVFTRGETQALAVTTLGSMSDKQIMDELEGDYKKRFMLHYNFPHFATGETGFPRGPGRREIGHGHLAERSLTPLLPTEEQFPYTVRVVSEILESNGSSSMASVCGSCLSLMDAGVPVKGMAAGIAMGIADIGDEKVLLVDIAGEEDHLGNMDLKIAGTKKGITAVQMDLKMESLDVETFKKALALSKEARCKIIDVMSGALAGSREKVSEFAPQIDSVKIKVDKIGALIGPGGKNIKGIIAETGCEVNVDDEGLVQLAADSVESIDAAKQMIEYLVGDVEVGKIHMGKVIKTVNFGAFVQIYPGTEGLVHISELAPKRINMVTDVAQEGEQLLVKVLSVDDRGKIRLSRKEALRDLKISDESQYNK
ncbi:MAG: polyribonucleotide nucleotidyltransferase [Elusimicrobiota bacterium]|nr:polyribonucleotide nucleotidyltransferase [Elusimicrobiota bacterium]